MKSIASMSAIVIGTRLIAQSIALLLFYYITVVFFSFSPSLDASRIQAAEKVPCMTGMKGQGASEQQICLEEHISGFGGWYRESRCTMVAFLTDPAQEEAARAILEPFFKEMTPDCGSRVTVATRRGQYKFTELSRWSSEAAFLQYLPGVFGGTTQVPFFENRIHLRVENEEAVPLVKQRLREYDIPFEAFRISSAEAELKAKATRLASFSTAPEIRHSKSGEQVVVPAVRWGGEKAAELIMGETSLDEVLRMLPPFPGHGPKKPSGKIGEHMSAEIKKVLRRGKLGYNPAYTQTIVSFNRKKKLIFVHNMVEREQAERFTEELDLIADMHEVHRDSKTIVKDGKLTPCVLVQTTAIMDDEKNKARVNGAAYFFTCKTKKTK